MIVTLPIRLVSEANSREHWAKKAKRTKATRCAVFLALCAKGHRGGLAASPVARATVHIVRIAPRGFDDDNMVRSAKAVRDSVAEYLGLDDRTDRIRWTYAQERGGVGVYAVRIHVEEFTPALPTYILETIDEARTSAGGKR